MSDDLNLPKSLLPSKSWGLSRAILTWSPTFSRFIFVPFSQATGTSDFGIDFN